MLFYVLEPAAACDGAADLARRVVDMMLDDDCVTAAEAARATGMSPLLSSWVIVPHFPGLSGRPGCVRSSAWIWLFSSMETTLAQQKPIEASNQRL